VHTPGPNVEPPLVSAQIILYFRLIFVYEITPNFHSKFGERKLLLGRITRMD